MTILLATLGLLVAEPPAGTWFFGLGLSSVHTPDQRFMGRGTAPSFPNGLGLSLEAQIESRRFFAAATLLFSPQPGGSAVSSIAGRVGWFVLDGEVTPYLAAGAGWLQESFGDGDAPPNWLAADGVALLGEVGVEAFRDARFFRAIGYVQGLWPQFEVPPYVLHAAPVTKSCLLFGVRLLF